MGLQQRTNQRWRSMEGSLPNKRRTIRTNGDVLWLNQLPSYLPNHDEHHIRPRNSRTMADGIHGRYGYTHQKTRRRDGTTTYRMTLHMCPMHSCKTSGTQPFSQTRKMYLRTTPNRVPRSNGRPRNSTNG